MAIIIITISFVCLIIAVALIVNVPYTTKVCFCSFELLFPLSASILKSSVYSIPVSAKEFYLPSPTII